MRGKKLTPSCALPRNSYPKEEAAVMIIHDNDNYPDAPLPLF